MLRIFPFFAVVLIGAPAGAQDADPAILDEVSICAGNLDDCQVTELDRIHVVADRAPDAPGLVLGIGGAQLRDLTPDHPAETINSLPAVNIQMNSGQEHLVAIRSPVLTGGAGQGSFLILENGLPLQPQALFVKPECELCFCLERQAHFLFSCLSNPNRIQDFCRLAEVCEGETL